jgi:hypothetical protein
MSNYRNLLFPAFFMVGGVLAACACFRTAAEAAETAKGMLAAQIRTQGATCGKPLSAARDAKRSGPDHEVWILRCNNAIYRVSRYPDMAAKVEQLR